MPCESGSDKKLLLLPIASREVSAQEKEPRPSSEQKTHQ